MSASLVGSEMCIRDRATTPWTSPTGASSAGRKHQSGGSGGVVALRGTVGSCLLYTSDAADDM
eukprot:12823190-Alexandrium_andersonii.AAC.1